MMTGVNEELRKFLVALAKVAGIVLVIALFGGVGGDGCFFLWGC